MILMTPVWIGQFHGEISAQTPIGSRRTMALPMRDSKGYSRRMSRATLMWSAGPVTWARLLTGMPTSRAISSENSSM